MGLALTKRTIKNIREAHAKGVSVKRLAKRHSVSLATVYRYVKNQSCPDKAYQPKPTTKDNVRQLKDLGLSVEEIAVKLGVSWQTVKTHLSKPCIHVNGRPQTKHSDKDERLLQTIRHMRKRGLSSESVAMQTYPGHRSPFDGKPVSADYYRRWREQIERMDDC